jgi:NAD(P)H-dependent FMN reductase
MVVQYGELPATAQGMPTVRVIPADAKVFVRPEVLSDVVTVTHAGAVLDLVDRRDGWYWVLLGRDLNGSRQPGWIQAEHVAIATAPTSGNSLRTLHEELGALPASAAPPSADSRKAEREKAKKAAADARAAARIEEATRNVEEARRQYEELVKKAE